MYLTRPGDKYVVPTGSYLGQMTNEMAEDERILEFVSGGPKQYGIKYFSEQEQKEKTIVKVRGFSLKHKASKDLNFDSMKRLVQSMVKKTGDNTPVTLTFPQIVRDSDKNVKTKIAQKVYAPVYNKRVYLSDYGTLPYGFCN